MKPAGYEHRLYGEASKYTGLFFPVNQNELEKLSSLSLISLNLLRAEGQKMNTAVLKLSEPKIGDQIPDVPAVGAN